MSLFAATLLMLAGGTGQRVIDNWMVYDGADKNREWIIFVEKSALFQRPDGWVNFSYFEVMNGSRLKSVKSRNMSAWANCETREFVNDYRITYGVDGKILLQEKIEEPRRVVTSGSIEERILAFACGDTRTAVQMPKGANLIVAANELYARGNQAITNAPPPRAPATSVAKPAPAPIPATGRTADYWLVYPTMDDEIAGIVDGDANFGGIVLFIERSTIQLRPDGWTLFDYVDVRNGSDEAKDFKWRRLSTRMNCKTRQFADERIQVYNNNGARTAGVKASMPPQPVPDNSLHDALLTFVCGNTNGAEQLPRGADPVAYANDLFARGRAPTTKAPAASSSAPSARNAEFWLVMATPNGNFTVFVDRASIAKRDDGKTFVAIDTVDRDSDGLHWFKARTLLDCVRRRSHDLEVDVYRLDGTYGGRLPDHPEKAVVPGSYMQDVLAFVCSGSRQNTLKLEPGQTTLEASALVQRNLSAENPSSPKE